ncbi:hypothetical protein GWN26_09330 [Candidatus Saccharibacteria bacterium]|nr:hypothetical protein [Candidatus Saccharibacteria bacterium]
MKSPFLNGACGSVVVLGLPLGVMVALSSGSIMAGLVSMITVVCVVMVACRKDIFREYRQRKTPR